MFAQALAHLVSSQFGFQVLQLATSLAEASLAIEQHQPDLVILDLELGDGSGMTLLETVLGQRDCLNPSVIVVSGHVSRFFCPPPLRPVIAGVVDKSQAFEEVVRVIHQVVLQRGDDLPHHALARVHARLTARERDVFALLGSGLSSRQIADCLKISVRTVETHRKNINAKTGSSGAELMRLATLAGQAAQPGQALRS
jgi:DNA-binding NarL/FixJ family response regulator